MKKEILRKAAYWLQVEEVSHEPAVQRYARRKYEQYMSSLKPVALRLAVGR
ncbi:hypothetical protein [Paenibacillus whitsoniae]|uniref:hypothetical protein n=1 Tax=Paenibacillus whitsoniae TaxID=2496558 RepID=UPI0013DF6872|nr:hypothetical protein [Paenibacillus whitsoniae]